jgi:hypothetical protein
MNLWNICSMANKHRYSAAEVAQALIETKGMVYIAAQRLNCTVETIRLYCKRYPSVQAARDAQRGIMVDTAELKLWQSIQNGEAWGIALCLKTLGKDRGYIEQQKLALTDPSGEQPYAPKVTVAITEDYAQEVAQLLAQFGLLALSPDTPTSLELPQNGTTHPHAE